ncbi:THAP domain-containing protein 3 [Nymphon striatum]|nr:THAP domain-containing protein 3 [Nymphon striatum]
MSTQSMSTKKRGGKRCCAYACQNTFYTSDMSFFTFPNPSTVLGKERSEKWRLNSRISRIDGLILEQQHTSKVLCSEHFEDSQFINVHRRNRLIKTAIPTIFKVQNPPLQITPDGSNQRKLQSITKTAILEPKVKKRGGKNCAAYGCEVTSQQISGLTPLQAKLKSTAVPHIFSWQKKKSTSALKRDERAKKKLEKEQTSSDDLDAGAEETVLNDDDVTGKIQLLDN